MICGAARGVWDVAMEENRACKLGLNPKRYRLTPWLLYKSWLGGTGKPSVVNAEAAKKIKRFAFSVSL